MANAKHITAKTTDDLATATERVNQARGILMAIAINNPANVRGNVPEEFLYLAMEGAGALLRESEELLGQVETTVLKARDNE